jgi:hypothetical protein
VTAGVSMMSKTREWWIQALSRLLTHQILQKSDNEDDSMWREIPGTEISDDEGPCSNVHFRGTSKLFLMFIARRKQISIRLGAHMYLNYIIIFPNRSPRACGRYIHKLPLLVPHAFTTNVMTGGECTELHNALLFLGKAC